MFDYFIDFFKTERATSLISLLSTHSKQCSQEANKIINVKFLGSVHEMVYVRLE